MSRCILILILFFFNSCKDAVPSGIIKPNKMQEILWDVFRADALAQQSVKNDSTKIVAEENSMLTLKVFSIHGITKEQFDKSYAYYSQHPDVMRTVLDSLSAQKTRVDTLALPAKFKRLLKDTVK